MISVHRSGDRRPGPLDGEHSLLSVPLDESTGRRIEENGFDTEEGKGRRSRLGLGRSRKGTMALTKEKKTQVSNERRKEKMEK